MKTLSFKILALCALIATPSFAHLIYNQDCDDSPKAAGEFTPSPRGDLPGEMFLDSAPTSGLSGIMGRSGVTGPEADDLKCYSDDPDVQKLRADQPNAPESDRRAAMNFCRLGSYLNPIECANDVIEKHLIREAKGCLDSAAAIGNSLAINPVAHRYGSDATGTPGTYHLDYKYSKEMGMHRYDWTPESRDRAGHKYAVTMIEEARKLREINSRTESDKTNTSGNAGVNGQVSTNAGLVGFGLGANAGVSGGNEKEVSREKGPLTQSEIDKLFKKYYDIGYSYPMLGDIHPNIICNQNERTCSSDSPKGLIKNIDYKADPVRNDNKNSSTNEDKPSSRDTSGNDRNPATADNHDRSADDQPIETKDHGSWAGEPTPSRPGEMWADYSQNVGDNDPIAACLFKGYLAKIKDTSAKHFEPGAPNKSDAERKREANILLAQGFCQVEYFGRDYCVNWKKKFQLIDSAPELMPNVVLPPRLESNPGAPHFMQPEGRASADLLKNFSRPALPKSPPDLQKIP